MTEHLPAALRRQLVDMANANEATMDGTMRPVLELVTANEVVFGVWQDDTQPNGVGVLLVKGANRLREIIATGVSQEHKITAIKCTAPEQAEALRQHVDFDQTH